VQRRISADPALKPGKCIADPDITPPIYRAETEISPLPAIGHIDQEAKRRISIRDASVTNTPTTGTAMTPSVTTDIAAIGGVTMVTIASTTAV
jgi:hypothetical protein